MLEVLCQGWLAALGAMRLGTTCRATTLNHVLSVGCTSDPPGERSRLLMPRPQPT